jgi:RHS repeat-associated protein
VTDAGGNTLSRIEHTPFGDIVQVQSGTAISDSSDDYFFTGKEKDATGLYFFGARYYDPEIGQFISEDPGQDGTNWYGYCENNPINMVDPDGCYAETFLDIGFIVYDVKTIMANPRDWTNWAALGLDTGCAFLPVATGGGLLVRGGKAGAQLVAHTSVWSLGACARGYEIERTLGGMCNNFPVIDKFTNASNGIAKSIASIKSINLRAKTYQRVNGVYNKIMNDANKLASFTTTFYNDIKVAVNSSTIRTLEVAIPKGASKSQMKEIARAINDAAKKGIQVIIYIIK